MNVYEWESEKKNISISHFVNFMNEKSLEDLQK